jgi:hypothetical protein
MGAPARVRRSGALRPLRLASEEVRISMSRLYAPKRKPKTAREQYQRLGGAAFRDLFRFDFDELPHLHTLLDIPETVRFDGRGTLGGIDVLAITLHRLALPSTLAGEAVF